MLKGIQTSLKSPVIVSGMYLLVLVSPSGAMCILLTWSHHQGVSGDGGFPLTMLGSGTSPVVRRRDETHPTRQTRHGEGVLLPKGGEPDVRPGGAILKTCVPNNRTSKYIIELTKLKEKLESSQLGFLFPTPLEDWI